MEQIAGMKNDVFVFDIKQTIVLKIRQLKAFEVFILNTCQIQSGGGGKACQVAADFW